MNKKFYAILHNIRSAYNVGSMFRTADALGVEKIFLTGYTPTPEHKQVAKTALGAERMVEWKKYWHINQVFKKLRKQKIKIYALEINPPIGISKLELLDDMKPEESLALLVGNEVRGISNVLLDKVDKIIEIPMQGGKESLNVAVSFGIASYNIKNKLN